MRREQSIATRRFGVMVSRWRPRSRKNVMNSTLTHCAYTLFQARAFNIVLMNYMGAREHSFVISKWTHIYSIKKGISLLCDGWVCEWTANLLCWVVQTDLKIMLVFDARRSIHTPFHNIQVQSNVTNRVKMRLPLIQEETIHWGAPVGCGRYCAPFWCTSINTTKFN